MPKPIKRERVSSAPKVVRVLPLEDVEHLNRFWRRRLASTDRRKPRPRPEDCPHDPADLVNDPASALVWCRRCRMTMTHAQVAERLAAALGVKEE